MNHTTIITSDKNWMESTAIAQFNALAALPGAVAAAALPDLHAGKTPVGVALQTSGLLYPHLIGGDIGCGMALFNTGLPLKKCNEKKWVARLNNIRELADLPTQNPYGEPGPITDLGTLGGGNHFAEFQAVHEVLNQEAFAALGLPQNGLALLVHTGSRGYGQQIYNSLGPQTGLAAESGAAKAYLAQHQNALLWAQRNRAMVAQKLLGHLGYQTQPQPLADLCHNFIQQQGSLFLHRKGVVSATQGLVVLPGSRGSLTYLLKPAQNTALSLWSLSHGAGRKWARSLCSGRIKAKYTKQSIRQTALKSKVVCHDTPLLYQEAPEAYKNIQHVLNALLQHNLATVVATLRPLITYKG
ncbi:MAG: RNA ligase RtcB family protein [Oscillospiraceae bacterium]